MIEPYRWPCSRVKEEEMAKLVEWRQKTGLPITELVKRCIATATFSQVVNFKEKGGKQCKN